MRTSNGTPGSNSLIRKSTHITIVDVVRKFVYFTSEKILSFPWRNGHVPRMKNKTITRIMHAALLSQ